MTHLLIENPIIIVVNLYNNFVECSVENMKISEGSYTFEQALDKVIKKLKLYKGVAFMEANTPIYFMNDLR